MVGVAPRSAEELEAGAYNARFFSAPASEFANFVRRFPSNGSFRTIRASPTKRSPTSSR